MRYHITSSTFAEIELPGLGWIVVNAEDCVLQPLTHNASKNLHETLHAGLAPSVLAALNGVEALASHLFPGMPHRWLWAIDDCTDEDAEQN